MIEKSQNIPSRNDIRHNSILKKSSVVRGKMTRSKSEVPKSVGFSDGKLKTVINFEPYAHEKEYLSQTKGFKKLDKKNKGCSCQVF